MSTPQIILIAWYATSLLLAANLHGKPREGTYNFWYALLAISIQIVILYFGGFFFN